MPTTPERAVVHRLQQALSYTDTPLTQTQADQMVQILAATAPTAGSGLAGGANVAIAGSRNGAQKGVMISTESPDGFGGEGSQITNQTLARAAGVLSAPQLEELQRIQEQQRAIEQVKQQVIQGGATAGPPPPSGD